MIHVKDSLLAMGSSFGYWTSYEYANFNQPFIKQKNGGFFWRINPNFEKLSFCTPISLKKWGCLDFQGIFLVLFVYNYIMIPSESWHFKFWLHFWRKTYTPQNWRVQCFSGCIYIYTYDMIQEDPNIPLEHTPAVPKPPNEGKSFINCLFWVWGMFQGYVGKFLDMPKPHGSKYLDPMQSLGGIHFRGIVG